MAMRCSIVQWCDPKVTLGIDFRATGQDLTGRIGHAIRSRQDKWGSPLLVHSLHCIPDIIAQGLHDVVKLALQRSLNNWMLSSLRHTSILRCRYDAVLVVEVDEPALLIYGEQLRVASSRLEKMHFDIDEK
jgi:hypothetical protein